jgi:hypothetical protein
MKQATFLYGMILGAVLSGTALGAEFTVAELHKSSQAATETFKKDYALLYDAIYAFQVMKGRDNGTVKIFYRQNNEAKTIEYFCHYHTPSEFDCHER